VGGIVEVFEDTSKIFAFIHCLHSSSKAVQTLVVQINN